jgi:hypothetical protein
VAEFKKKGRSSEYSVSLLRLSGAFSTFAQIGDYLNIHYATASKGGQTDQ